MRRAEKINIISFAGELTPPTQKKFSFVVKLRRGCQFTSERDRERGLWVLK